MVAQGNEETGTSAGRLKGGVAFPARMPPRVPKVRVGTSTALPTSTWLRPKRVAMVSSGTADSNTKPVGPGGRDIGQ